LQHSSIALRQIDIQSSLISALTKQFFGVFLLNFLSPCVAMMTSLAMSIALSSCSPSKELEASRAAFSAACHGTPLRTAEARNKALEDGYNINREFDCIDKASYAAVADAHAKWQAANTPEAIALRQAEHAKKVALAQAQRAAEVERERADTRTPEVPPPIVLR
jgi:hypothetical protein